jgi:hypothetical protein
MIINATWQFMTASVFAQESSRIVTTGDLRKRALPVETSSKFLPAPWLQPAAHDGETRCFAGRRSHVIECSVLAPVDDLERFVAVAEIRPDGTCLLNPKGFDYGLVPALRELNPAQADLLFGRTTNMPVPDRPGRYRLKSKFDQDFLLDVVFESNRAVKYRLTAVNFKTLDRLNEARLGDWHALD